MKHLLLLSLLIPFASVAAQPEQMPLAGHRSPTYVTVSPLYQHYEGDGMNLSEFSMAMFAHVPLRRNLSASLRISQANAEGEALAAVNGLTDAQVAVSYARALGRGSLVLNVGVNLPSGKQHLTQPESRTLLLLSRSVFDFQVPSFGQGLGLSPAATVAFPVSDNFVLGVGLAYQLRGSYEPLEDLIDSYDPGDEVLATGGFDVRLSERATLSVDLSYVLYGTDMIGGEEVFKSGDKLVASVQFRRNAVFNEVWLVARYRSRARNSLPIDGVLITEDAKTSPDQIEVFGHYRFQLHRRIAVSLLGELRHVEAVLGQPGFSQSTLAGGGVGPEFLITRSVRLSGRFSYLLGDMSGVEAGASFAVAL